MKAECFTPILKLVLLALFFPFLGQAQNSNPCDDGDPNTIDVVDGEGNCLHINRVCKEGEPTTITLVIPSAKECKDVPCDDGDPKTVDIVDINGECHHIQKGCDDGDPTTLDYVDENGDCVNEKIVCDDGDPETEDYLDENGVCHHVKVECPLDPCEEDEVAPWAECKYQITVKLGEGGMATIDPSDIDNGSNDECSEVDLGIDINKFDCDDLGWNTVELTVVDASGNEAKCSTKVKVTDPDNTCYDPCEPDETKPWAKCKDDFTVKLQEDGEVRIWISEIDDGSHDDCGDVDLWIDKDKFDCDDLGWNTVKLTVKDKAGHKAYCTTKVKVTDPYNYCYDPCKPDETKPIAKCKDNFTVNLKENGMVQIWISEIDDGSYDECGEVDLWIDKDKFDCDDLGWNTVKLTVKDKKGHKAYCTTKVKVKDPYNYCYDPCKPDETKPWAKCKDDFTVKLKENGKVQIWVSEIDNGSYDECGEVDLWIDKDKFDCDDLGWNTVKLTVKDKKGHKAYCTTKVKVTDPYNYCYDPCKPDETKPWAKCKDEVVVKLKDGGVVTVPASLIDDGSKDDCSDVWLTLDRYKFTCDDIGKHKVELTVKDRAGNKAHCISWVSVTDPYNKCYDPCKPDETKPHAKCKDDFTVKLGDGGKVQIWLSEIDNGSYDECGEVEKWIDKDKFDCDDLGWNTVKLTVKDKAGHKAYCTTKVKVTDPYNKCYDPCDPDNTKPWAECKEVLWVKLGDGGIKYIDPYDIDKGSKDDCSDVWLSVDKNKFTCDDLGWNTVTLTVKDRSNNIARCQTRVHVSDPYNKCYDPCDPDNSRPWARCKDEITVELGNDGKKSISVFDVNDGSKDDCSEVWLSLDKSHFDCDDLGRQYVTLTVKDKADNKATCKTKVKVTDPKGACEQDVCDPDNTKPVAKCKDEIEVKLKPYKSVRVGVDDINDGSYDECGDVKLKVKDYLFVCRSLGVNYTTLIVEDKSGNKSECVTKVVVTDPYDYCDGMVMEDCKEDLEDCEVSISWYSCTTLKICIGKFELSNIRIDVDKIGYQNDDIDMKFDDLEGNYFYFDVEKYGIPNGFWIKSSNRCGKCGDDDDGDDEVDWEAEPCPKDNGAGPYYPTPERPEKCSWGQMGKPSSSSELQSDPSTLNPDEIFNTPLPLDVAGPENFESVNIFPNPGSGKVFVSMKGYEQTDLQLLIYNAMGEQLRTIKTVPADEPQDLGVDDFAPGLYYLRVVKPNGEFTAKEFVIKR